MHIDSPQRRRHSISLTPLIDVVFILLVFFMLATSFTDWRPITLTTGVGESGDRANSTAVVHVAPDGHLSYKQHRFTAERLAAKLVAAQNSATITAVIVAPNPNASLDATIHALDALSGVGVRQISLAPGGGS